jgi:hypothetical protein
VPITINDVDDLVRLLEQNPDWQARLACALLNKQTLERLLLEDPALAETLRAALIGDQLERLIAAVQELSAISRQWVARLDRHEAELQELRRTVAELGPARGGSSGKSATIFLTGLLSSVDC